MRESSLAEVAPYLLFAAAYIILMGMSKCLLNHYHPAGTYYNPRDPLLSENAWLSLFWPFSGLWFLGVFGGRITIKLLSALGRAWSRMKGRMVDLWFGGL